MKKQKNALDDAIDRLRREARSMKDDTIDILRREVRELQEDHIRLADELASERFRCELFKSTAIAMRQYTSVVGCRLLAQALEDDAGRAKPVVKVAKPDNGGEGFDGRFALRT